MSGWSINNIQARLRGLGSDWHKQLADERTAAARACIIEAIENYPEPAEPFILIVTDRDEKTFSVEGPMADDNPWSDAVVDAQKSGRQVKRPRARQPFSVPFARSRLATPPYDWRNKADDGVLAPVKIASVHRLRFVEPSQ